MQKFIRELKPGDTVQVTYTESVAVEVIPAS
jgi:TusA-related sulfurtransferase